MAQANQDLGSAPLDKIQLIPSGREDEMVVPIQVITKSQAKENP